jgi:hypothetical protein
VAPPPKNQRNVESMSSFQIGRSTKEAMTALPPMDSRQSFRIEVNFAGENRDCSARLVTISLSPQTFGYVLNLIERSGRRSLKIAHFISAVKKRRVPKWNQGAVGLSILTLVVAGTLLFAQAPCVPKTIVPQDANPGCGKLPLFQVIRRTSVVRNQNVLGRLSGSAPVAT